MKGVIVEKERGWNVDSEAQNQTTHEFIPQDRNLNEEWGRGRLGKLTTSGNPDYQFTKESRPHASEPGTQTLTVNSEKANKSPPMHRNHTSPNLASTPSRPPRPYPLEMR